MNKTKTIRKLFYYSVAFSFSTFALTGCGLGEGELLSDVIVTPTPGYENMAKQQTFIESKIDIIMIHPSEMNSTIRYETLQLSGTIISNIPVKKFSVKVNGIEIDYLRAGQRAQKCHAVSDRLVTGRFQFAANADLAGKFQ